MNSEEKFSFQDGNVSAGRTHKQIWQFRAKLPTTIFTKSVR